MYDLFPMNSSWKKTTQSSGFPALVHWSGGGWARVCVEAESNLNDLIDEYQEYQDASAFDFDSEGDELDEEDDEENAKTQMRWPNLASKENALGVVHYNMANEKG